MPGVHVCAPVVADALPQRENAMSDSSHDKPQGTAHKGEGVDRRDVLLTGATLVAASALPGPTGLTQQAQAQQQAQPDAAAGAAAEHRVHHGRRHRLVQHRRLSPA
jgi:hypothetical protein